MDIIVVSIGALSKNPLWDEKVPVRPSHATTTLVRSGPVNLLIDPSLPIQALASRLDERAGIKPKDITHVFLTNWRPVHRRGLAAFEHATWWMHPLEIQSAQEQLAQAQERLDRAQDQGSTPDKEVQALIASEAQLLQRLQPAPDELGDSIDLFPLPGYTAGQCGLLLSETTRTTIVAGDAVPTAAHFLAGQVFPDSYDLAKAKESLVELYEIADLIIPGHDNLFPVPRTSGI